MSIDLSKHIEELVTKYNIQVEQLTKDQLVRAFRQALLSGDFVRLVQQDKQAVTYIPYREVCTLQARIAELAKALDDIKAVLERPAGNMRFMQIAGPARQCLNIIKSIHSNNYALNPND